MSALNVLAIVPAALVFLALVLLVAAVCGSGRDDGTNPDRRPE